MAGKQKRLYSPHCQKKSKFMKARLGGELSAFPGENMSLAGPFRGASLLPKASSSPPKPHLTVGHKLN